jgi:AcrR family transcriptional regulator
MTSSPTPGLRDRKRLETRARIEDAAIHLVLRDGLEATTVDAISERADVSPRTFFNYFDSKDSAILGIHQRDLTDELVGEHVARHRAEHAGSGTAHDLVSSVVRLLFSVMGAPLAARASLHADRIEVVKRHPQVLSGQFAQLTARSERLTEAIAELIASTPGISSDPAERPAQAELLLALGAGAARVAVREWVATGDDTDVDRTEDRAVILIERIVGILS